MKTSVLIYLLATAIIVTCQTTDSTTILATETSSEVQCSFLGPLISNDGCELCACVLGVKVCTNITCKLRKRRDASCVPGSTFEEDCNTCVCNRFGTIAYCTEMYCGTTAA